MTILGDARMYGRFALGLRRFLRQRTTVAEAEQHVRQELAQREANFLRLLERGVFGYRGSPYLPLLKLAGCELGDVRAMLQARGLEPTLLALREAGVYVSFEEFKGRQPIVRQGRVIPVRAQDFDNPYLSPAYYVQSGGSTGAGMRVPVDLDHWAATSPMMLLTCAIHGVLNTPTVLWRGALPDPTGFSNALQGARMGNPPRRWFTPLTKNDTRPALKQRLATNTAIRLARLYGSHIPWPEPLRLDQAVVVADWMSQTLRAEGTCLLRAPVSLSLRVALAAAEAGLDLHGATFMGGGEPPTPAKVREITASGARWVPNYAFAEHGVLATGCARPLDGNDLHFMKQNLGLIQYPRQVPGTEIEVPAFHFTSLMPTAPKLLLNVESDDYGVLETRACGCPLEALGLVEHLREVRSFRKLTGEGVTLVGSEMVRILEEVLPSRFGGGPQDYQLLEEEDERGFTRLNLLVHPRVEIPEEGAVIAVVLEALGRGSVAADLARALWAQSGTLRVKRQAPIWTARGKLMPLHLARRTERLTDTGGIGPATP